MEQREAGCGGPAPAVGREARREDGGVLRRPSVPCLEGRAAERGALRGKARRQGARTSMPDSFMDVAKSVRAMVLDGLRAATLGFKVWSTAGAADRATTPCRPAQVAQSCRGSSGHPPGFEAERYTTPPERMRIPRYVSPAKRPPNSSGPAALIPRKAPITKKCTSICWICSHLQPARAWWPGAGRTASREVVAQPYRARTWEPHFPATQMRRGTPPEPR